MLLSLEHTFTDFHLLSQAGVVGYHLSSNDLSVEDEVNSLKTVMDEMKQALSEARGRTRRTHATPIGELGSS